MSSASKRTGVQQGHVARKRFGQNFLVDMGVIDAIVSAISPRADDLMVEIGPGLGALTTPLTEWLTHLHVVELDRDLVGRLSRKFGERVSVHAGDALDFDFGSLVSEDRRDEAPLRVVGNLPYNISSPLLFHLMRYATLVRDQHFMLQNEVVERMVAPAGSSNYSRLSVMLQYRYWMDKVLDVPPDAFNPPPKVDSAVVRMIPRAVADLPQVDLDVFEAVVAQAFSQRRKMLRNTLNSYRDRVDFDALGFDLTRRAEDVPVDEYVSLSRAISGAGSPG
ncbi:16S rRNA (adenine(1518)-N(6)/adenine(1519)-N(6))-dimethyltransferase RsmA [Pandoraea apista]|uniref:Ribosomal RNA small subunit methyltransferase A n=1 Tax=Pandoraea apista TaxID=93218 RepID=A0ABX9ZPS3_9BURK|nr:16S rRNA (adenine(1518)-N(6)/adenine(1519)-N(6))-dimethyltransferase RsmA [Pandoraea apista]PTD99614.1 16S rRNA (adenine(1518)-N(6)/adenine(1519)-N(6))-dimethyltransferase [Pandoraea apista]RRJ28125.1 16S rRNA (adenine(1518)-N(6)/adenine(1519)-N(6))-dimethyltransferase RsmA [Pandoraea apista]RRJ73437.1 16S rRNA (adenine(1518)-N(6)/adenine(1519)-N(6))-dimethyltransferase RsmA [Pandoraea apista]RSC97975.1 16S rRNA (adenine(1518)-N(6)/adenine(1519)-N(6))-dimethyltransferase RsmA [Pandoraea apis